MPVEARRGLLDTNIVILRRSIEPRELPDETAISAAVHARGRSPRRRIADLMIASIAAASELPLFTTNPADFAGLDGIVEVVPVRRPSS